MSVCVLSFVCFCDNASIVSIKRGLYVHACIHVCVCMYSM